MISKEHASLFAILVTSVRDGRLAVISMKGQDGKDASILVHRDGDDIFPLGMLLDDAVASTFEEPTQGADMLIMPAPARATSNVATSNVGGTNDSGTSKQD